MLFLDLILFNSSLNFVKYFSKFCKVFLNSDIQNVHKIIYMCILKMFFVSFTLSAIIYLIGRLSLYSVYDLCISNSWQIMFYFGFNEWWVFALCIMYFKINEFNNIYFYFNTCNYINFEHETSNKFISLNLSVIIFFKIIKIFCIFSSSCSVIVNIY